MATTRLISMHISKGKTIAQCLTDRTDYSKNPDKTNDGEYVRAYECDPATVDAEFLLSKREYRVQTGRTQARDVLAYQVRQSFKPGEITPEEANHLEELYAKRFLIKGSRQEVQTILEEEIERFKLDELMFYIPLYHEEDQLRSYKMLAEMFG